VAQFFFFEAKEILKGLNKKSLDLFISRVSLISAVSLQHADEDD
jgi:hypothetical protein